MKALILMPDSKYYIKGLNGTLRFQDHRNLSSSCRGRKKKHGDERMAIEEENKSKQLIHKEKPLIKWWNSLTAANKMTLIAAVIAAVIGPVLTTILGSLFSEPVSTGDTYRISITLQQYEQGLKRREVEVREELKQTHAKDWQVLETELQTIKTKLQNIKTSYEEHITRLKERIVQLETLRGQFSDELLTQAINSLKQGDNQKANQLLKQVEEQADPVIKVVAEAAYQRCLIAEEDIRYLKALEHCEKAVRLAAENTLYLNKTGLLNQTLANYEKAIAYFEQALASDLKTYGEAHPAVARDRNNLGAAWISLGDYQKAIEYFELVLITLEKKLGKDHPNTKKARNNLVIARKKLAETATN